MKFYEWLEVQKRGTLSEGLAVWICGDCHAGNLGPLGMRTAKYACRYAISIRPWSAIHPTT